MFDRSDGLEMFSELKISFEYTKQKYKNSLDNLILKTKYFIIIYQP